MGIIALAAGLTMGLAAAAIGIGQSVVASNAMKGIARQPEMAGRLTTGMIISMAIMETALVLTFVIALMIVGKIG